MLTLKKEEIKEDEDFLKLKALIVKYHQPAEHTIKNLVPMVGIKGYCEESCHFAQWESKEGHPLHLSYTVFTWVEKLEEGYKFPVEIRSITVYDDKLEYEIAKTKLRQN